MGGWEREIDKGEGRSERERGREGERGVSE